MKPVLKFQSFVLSLSTFAVFSIWIAFNKIATAYPLISIITVPFISLGVYRTVVHFLSSLFRKCTIIKKYIMGPYYLDGTWVGFYVGASGNIRFFIECFEQELDSLIIRGESYDCDLNYHSMWLAESVNIDIKQGKLFYMYEVSALRDISYNVGVAFFNFVRKNQHTPPEKLLGFSADLHISKKIKAMEIKLLDSSISDKEKLERALSLYKENKNKF